MILGAIGVFVIAIGAGYVCAVGRLANPGIINALIAGAMAAGEMEVRYTQQRRIHEAKIKAEILRQTANEEASHGSG